MASSSLPEHWTIAEKVQNASLAFEILSKQYLIWAFTGVTIVHKPFLLKLSQAKAWQELMNPQGWVLENHLMMTHRFGTPRLLLAHS